MACEQVASDLGLGGGFPGYSGVLHHLQLAISHKITLIRSEILMTNKMPKSAAFIIIIIIIFFFFWGGGGGINL